MATSGRAPGFGLTLAYREWDAGARGLPLILLHGITRSSVHWEGVARRLAGRRLIAFDARGHGESDWDPAEEYSTDQHFADLATALRALGIDRCILAGFSMGGGIAMLTAASLPDRIAGVAIIDAYPHPEMSAGSRRIAHWVSTSAHHHEHFDLAIARHFRDLLAAGLETRLDLRPMWQAIECPALVVRGANSDVFPALLADEMIASQPRSRLVTIDGVAHPIPARKPRELAALLSAFAEDVDPSPR
jgi:esterase